MKKINLCILSLSVMALSLVSCEKEEIGNGNSTHFTASIEPGDGSKTALNSSTINWVSGDQIKIYGTNTDGCVYTGTPQSDDATYADFVSSNGDAGNPNSTSPAFTAIYPAVNAVSSTVFTIPAEQSYSTSSPIVGLPMYGVSTTDNPYELTFKNLCGAVKIRLNTSATTAPTVTKIEITTNTYINGDYSISNSGQTITKVDGTKNHTNRTTLICSQTLSSSYSDFYVFLPEGDYSFFKIKIYSSTGATCTKTLNSGNTLNVTRSKYTQITFANPTFATPPTGSTLSGFFTINSDGDRVRFSKGNLLKTGTNPNTYAFCDEQYHYTETSATAYLHTGGSNCRSLNITNGGGTSNQWYCMDAIEAKGIFGYAPSSIPSRSTYRWALVKVDGRGGIILFPDNFYWPWDDIAEPSRKNRSLTADDDPWNGIDYDTDKWAILEEAGCVFLPGYQTIATQDNAQNYSYYWTTTPQGGYNDPNDYNANPNFRMFIWFDRKNNTFPGGPNGNTHSISNTDAIRLIMPVPATMTE